MRNDKQTELIPMVGISSLVVIFAVLCLTVFVLLSLSTVQANRKLSENAADAIQGYYAADCAAEEILARLRAGEFPAEVTEENGVYTYTCAISETQILAVEVVVDGADYTVLRWQAVSTAEWQADNRLPVWNAE